MDYINKHIHYKHIVEFKGMIDYFHPELQKYRVRISEWIVGYPHLNYWISEEDIKQYCTII